VDQAIFFGGEDVLADRKKVVVAVDEFEREHVDLSILLRIDYRRRIGRMRFQAAGQPASPGSFDSVRTSLREILPSLRMTRVF
jgi:hypothetical protein